MKAGIALLLFALPAMAIDTKPIGTGNGFLHCKLKYEAIVPSEPAPPTLHNRQQIPSQPRKGDFQVVAPAVSGTFSVQVIAIEQVDVRSVLTARTAACALTGLIDGDSFTIDTTAFPYAAVYEVWFYRDHPRGRELLYTFKEYY